MRCSVLLFAHRLARAFHPPVTATYRIPNIAWIKHLDNVEEDRSVGRTDRETVVPDSSVDDCRDTVEAACVLAEAHIPYSSQAAVAAVAAVAVARLDTVRAEEKVEMDAVGMRPG